MAKAEKPGTAETSKKGKKKLMMIIAAVMLLIAGGAAAFLLLKPAHAPASDAATEASHPEVPPKFVELGTFTANLVHEDGDRYLQIAISLKLTKPELEEKIKASNPEILHRVNMLLQSKRPSDLANLEGKEKLAEQIKAQVEYVMGFRKTPPVFSAEPVAVHNPEPTAIQNTEPAAQSVEPHAAQNPEPAAVQNEGERPAPATKVGAENPKTTTSGIADVLFTSFIIQ